MKASLASTLCSVVLGAVFVTPARGDDPVASAAAETGSVSIASGEQVAAQLPVPEALPQGVQTLPPGTYLPPTAYSPSYVYGPPDGAVVMGDGMPFGAPLPFGPMMIVEGVPSEGLGFEGGYLRFDAFLPKHVMPGRSLFFTSLAGTITDEADFAGNFGGGFRSIGWGNRIYGISGWYDIDDGHLDTYHRTGVSLESLGRYFDMRFNTYWLLTSSPQQELGEVICDPRFIGNNIFFRQQLATETPYGGYELEMGGLMPVLGKYGFYGYLGGYYLTGEDADDAVGWSLRFHIEVNESTTVGVRHTDDDVFGGNTWANIAITLPGAPNNWFKPRRVSQRLGVPVERFDRIHGDLEVDDIPILATNPLRPGQGANGNDGGFFVIHVDPNRGPGGSGTFEDPFGSLEEARLANNAGVDIIMVRPRADDTGINLDVTDPFALFDNQRLLSTTREHFFASSQFAENCPLPVVGPIGGLGPLISNNSLLAESVVLLEDNTEVSGFRIDGRPDVGTGNPVGAPLHDGILGQGDITDFVIAGNTFQNLVNGAVLTADGTGIFEENIIDGAGADTDRGFSVTTTAAGTLDVFISENTSQNVNGDNEDANGNTLLDPGEDVNGNGVLDLGTAFEVVANGGTANVDFRLNTSTSDDIGLQLSTANNGVLNATVGEILLVNGTEVVEANSFLESNLAGLRLAGVTGTINADIVGNLFDRPTSAGAGVLINTTDVNVTGNFLRNTISGGPAASFGIGGEMNGGISLLTIGDGTDDNANLITGNGDAGIGLIFNDGALVELQVLNNQIADTLDGPDPDFDGDGMRFIVLNAAQIDGDSVIDGNLVTNNAARGIAFLARDAAFIGGVEVTNNEVTDNGLVGIEFVRDGNAFIGAFGDRVLIADNLVDGNLNGVGLTAINQGTTDFYQVNDNQITNNTLVGVALRVEADADLDVNMERNIISGNGSHGVQLTEDINTATDTRSVTGVWVSNIISLNGGHGISSDAATDNLRVGLNGVDGTGRSLGNLISENGLDGVSITGPGSAVYTNNTITENGLAANGDADGHGVDIEGAGFKDLEFNNNLISENVGDGIEFRNQNNQFGFPFFFTGDGNEITFNGGRGVDILNQGTAISTFTLNNSDVSFNGEEGVYVVNTSSVTQDQIGPAPNNNPLVDPTHGMNADGATTAIPILFLNLDSNFITSNGSDSTFDGTGLVIRVGTSDGSAAFTDNGGYFNGGARGGVGATITNNDFDGVTNTGGNFGDDVVIESFTSTVDPVTTAGTWDTTDFEVTAFRGDPLARLDLVFLNNEGGSLDVVRTGAWYENDEAVFKSRTDDQDPAGPFNEGTRQRNAQRLALRGVHAPFGDFTAPVVSLDGGTFLYPGVGESTFRLLAGLGTNSFVGGDDFTDFAPIDLTPEFGELPYEYDPPTDTPTVPPQ